MLSCMEEANYVVDVNVLRRWDGNSTLLRLTARPVVMFLDEANSCLELAFHLNGAESQQVGGSAYDCKWNACEE
jgi:hypothetical protein